MDCGNKDHKHLDEEQLNALIDACFQSHAKAVNNIAAELKAQGICTADIYSVAATLAVKICHATIQHLTSGGGMPKEEAVSMIVGSICKRVDAQFIVSVEPLYENEVMH